MFWKSLLALIVIGVLVGLISNFGLKKRLLGKWWGAMVVAFIGAILGAFILHEWWVVGHVNVINALIGALVATYLVGIFSKKR